MRPCVDTEESENKTIRFLDDIIQERKLIAHSSYSMVVLNFPSYYDYLGWSNDELLSGGTITS